MCTHFDDWLAHLAYVVLYIELWGLFITTGQAERKLTGNETSGFRGPPHTIYECKHTLSTHTHTHTHTRYTLYSESEATITKAKIISSIFFPMGWTQRITFLSLSLSHFFIFFLGICRYVVKWRHTATRSACPFKVTSAVTMHLLMLAPSTFHK